MARVLIFIAFILGCALGYAVGSASPVEDLLDSVADPHCPNEDLHPLPQEQTA